MIFCAAVQRIIIFLSFYLYYLPLMLVNKVDQISDCLTACKIKEGLSEMSEFIGRSQGLQWLQVHPEGEKKCGGLI